MRITLKNFLFVRKKNISSKSEVAQAIKIKEMGGNNQRAECPFVGKL